MLVFVPLTATELAGWAGSGRFVPTPAFAVTASLRQAFGFTPAYGKLPIDRQLAEFTTKAKALFGSSSFAVIGTEKNIDKLVQNFLTRSQLMESAAASPYAAALTLLRRGA